MSAVSSPDPDLVAIESEVLSAGGLNSCGPDGGGIRATGWFGETEGRHMLSWRDTDNGDDEAAVLQSSFTRLCSFSIHEIYIYTHT